MIITKNHGGYFAIRTGVFALFGLGLLAGLSACEGGDTSTTHHRPGGGSHRVEVVTAERQPVSIQQTVTGTLEAVNRVRIYNEEGGRIQRLPFAQGDRVKKGELLVQMDDSLLQIDVSKAKAAREQAELDLSRLKTLLPKKISTEEEVARAETEVDLARAEEKYQRTRLARSRIRAPFDGVISQRLYEPGDMLAAQSHILTLIDASALRMKTSLAERWMPLLQPEQKVSLRIDALGGRAFDARVSRIYPAIDAKTHKGRLEILLQPVPDGARAGQFARADILLDGGRRLVVPVQAVQYEIEGAFVYRLRSDNEADDGKSRVEKVFVTPGRQFGNTLELVEGIAPGDVIVVRGFIGLRDNKVVSVANVGHKVADKVTDKAADKVPGQATGKSTGGEREPATR